MADAISDTPKKRGRPSTGGRKPGVMVRLTDGEIAALDAWIAAQPDAPTRPEAIRRLIESALR